MPHQAAPHRPGQGTTNEHPVFGVRRLLSLDTHTHTTEPACTHCDRTRTIAQPTGEALLSVTEWCRTSEPPLSSSKSDPGPAPPGMNVEELQRSAGGASVTEAGVRAEELLLCCQVHLKGRSNLSHTFQHPMLENTCPH